MSGTFEISKVNTENVLANASRICEDAPSRLACSGGEKATADFLLNELRPYSDEASEENFGTRPFASTFIYKSVCLLLIAAAVLFKFSEITGRPFPACISSFLCVLSFSLFAYKFLFNGKKLDYFFKKKTSTNLYFRRFARSTPLNRVVFTSHLDSPKAMNSMFYKIKSPVSLIICCLAGNTLNFCAVNLYLLFGAPENSVIFGALSSFCALFGIFYVITFLLFDSKKASSGAGTSVIPSLCLCEYFKLLSDNSVRFANTEICILISGAEYPCHAGAFDFTDRRKRAFRDIPTTFISLEEITSSDMAVFEKTKKRDSVSPAGVIKDIAKTYDIKLKPEKPVAGSSACTPFEEAGFDCCSFGTTKKLIYSSFSRNANTVSSVTKKAVFDALTVISETAKYYDNAINRE